MSKIQCRHKRTWFHLGLFAWALLFSFQVFNARAWEPDAPTELVVMFGKGGQSDRIARLSVDEASKLSGDKFKAYVVNRSGGGGAEALKYIANTKRPDRTLLLASQMIFEVGKRMSLDMSPDKFQPLAQLASDPFALWVHASSGISSFDEFVSRAKQNGPSRKDIQIGGAGFKADTSEMIDRLNKVVGLNTKHIPYPRVSSTLKGLLGQHVTAAIFRTSIRPPSPDYIPIATFTASEDQRFKGVTPLGKINDGLAYSNEFFIVGSPEMSSEARSYYRSLFEALAKSDSFRKKVTDMRLLPVESEKSSQLTWNRVLDEFTSAVRLNYLKGGGAGSSTSASSGSSSSSATTGSGTTTANVSSGGGASTSTDAPQTSDTGSNSDTDTSTVSRPYEGLKWNAWIEEYGSSPRYLPVPTIKSGQEYRVSLSLSGLDFGLAKKGGAVQAASSSLIKKMNALIDLDDSAVDLEVVLLYDPTYFTHSNVATVQARKRQKTLSIDLNKIDDARKSGFILPADKSPLEVLRNKRSAVGNLAKFHFGQVDFRLRTKDAIPNGVAEVLFSIWHQGRPLDEISVTFCAGSGTCAKPNVGVSPGGFDVIGAAQAPVNAKRAGIHFVEFATQNNEIKGVFRYPSPGGTFTFFDWTVGNRSTLLGDLQNIAQGFANAPDEAQRGVEGIKLLNSLFPSTSGKPATDAKNAFITFIRNKADTTDKYGKNAPPFFIRSSMQDTARPLLLPMTILNVRKADNSSLFLGQHFKVEMPLPIQAYKKPKTCLKNWVLVQPAMPDGDAALNSAFKQFENINTVRRAQPVITTPPQNGKTTYKIKNTQIPVFYKINDLIPWFLEAKGTPATLLSFVSHHGNGQLSFNPTSGPKLDKNLMERTFIEPSATILNGCGTGNQAAIEIIRHLNARGVQTVIATNNGVRGGLAGDFHACFVETVEDLTGIAPPSIRDAFYGTLRCLDNKPSNYGSEVLSYTILGNGELSICSP